MSSGHRRGPSCMNPPAAIIDANLYMVLATADAEGKPWSTPVHFAHVGHHEFFWVSSPEALHSRNIDARSRVGIAVFDSHTAIGTGQGVYLDATAALVEDADLARGTAVFSDRSLGHGGHAWTVDDVRAGSDIRLYRAVVEASWVLAEDGRPDHRVPVVLG